MDGKTKRRCEDFLQRNIVLQECSNFTQDYTKQGEVCVCGRDKTWHIQQTSARNNHKLHSPKQRNLIYGTIRFTNGYQKYNSVPYLKVEDYCHENYMSHIWKYLHDYWRVSTPRLFISITGGAKRFDLQPRLQKALKSGLINCAKTTGAWLITGGTKTGVRELVGEAVRDYYMTQKAGDQNVTALGIVTWNLIGSRESFIRAANEGSRSVAYNNNEVTVDSNTGAKSLPLEPNHTHFLFIDKSHSQKIGISNYHFRAALFDSMKMQRMDLSGKTVLMNIPKVVVIINGGLGTITEVLRFTTETKMPTVIVQGSGRAPDYLCKALDLVPLNGDGINEFPVDFDEQMLQFADKIFEWHKNTAEEKQALISQCISEVRIILEHRHLLTVYSLENEFKKGLDTAILESIFKANESDLQTLLHLGLAWNKIDLVRDKLFSMETKQQWKKQEHKELLEQAMLTALIQDQVEFVSLFLDNGIEWDSFLSLHTLRDLYYEIFIKRTNSNPTSDLVLDLLQANFIYEGSYQCCKSRQKSDSRTAQKLLGYIGKLIYMLSDGIISNLYQGKQYLVTNEYDNLNYNNRMSLKEPNSEVNNKLLNPARDLFIWCILQNRQEMAVQFWKESQYCIVSALIGCGLLKELAKYAEDLVEIEHAASLHEHANVFEKHAIGILSECYDTDRSVSRMILVNRVKMWDSVTVFDVANSMEMMDFMEHSACQTKLSQIWYGCLAQYTSIFQVIGTMLFPPVVFSIKFNETEDKPEDLKMMKSVMNMLPETDTKINPEEEEDDTLEPDNSNTTYDDDKHKKSVYSVRCWGGCGDSNSIGFLMALYYFINAPIVKFFYHTFYQILFLLLFSYVIIIEIKPIDKDWVSIPEFVIWAWAFTMWVEEVRQLFLESGKSFKSKFVTYFQNLWNILDGFCVWSMILAVILRFVLLGADFGWARVVYCLSLSFYYLRFLEVFFVERNLGPKVIMIKRMFKDLMFFVLIMVIFVFCYGSVSQALRFPNQNFSLDTLVNVIYEPYWNIYGELFLDTLEEETSSCTRNETLLVLDSSARLCENNRFFVFLFLAFYMLIMAILLLNLLIAMFSHTFQTVQDNAEKMWRFYRYGLIFEYYDRPAFPAPFIIINHLHRILMHLIALCRKSRKRNTEFSIDLSDEENNKILTLEHLAMEQYLHKLHIIKQDEISTKINNTEIKIDKLISCSENSKPLSRSISHHLYSKSQSVIESEHVSQISAQVNKQEQVIREMNQSLVTITQLLQDLHGNQQKQGTNSTDIDLNVTARESRTSVSKVRPKLEMRISDVNTWITQCPSQANENSDDNNGI